MKLKPMLPFILVTAGACNGGASGEAPEQDSTAVTNEQTATELVPQTGTFGEAFDASTYIESGDLLAMSKDTTSFNTVFKGTILEVCQKKGCWMTLDLGNGDKMRVTFKDYGFFVPKDASGKTAVVDGVAYHDTVSVETLKHFAGDEGLPQDSIDKITEPEVLLAFEAMGVVIQ